MLIAHLISNIIDSAKDASNGHSKEKSDLPMEERAGQTVVNTTYLQAISLFILVCS